MHNYIVRFITDKEVIERIYPAETAPKCLEVAQAHFMTWNADHGILHEIVVCPPEGQGHLPDMPDALEFYYLTPEGYAAIHDPFDAFDRRIKMAPRRGASAGPIGAGTWGERPNALKLGLDQFRRV